MTVVFKKHIRSPQASGLLWLVFFLLCGAPACAAPAFDSPLHTLRSVQQSVDTRDSDLFNRAVDIQSVVGKASDNLIAALRAQNTQGNLPASGLSMALALAGAAESAGQMELLRQFLVSEVKSFIAAGINNGYFAGDLKAKHSASPGSLASTLDKLPQGRRELVSGRILSEQNEKAVISALFVDPGAGRIPLRLALEKQNNEWRITEIVNAKEVFDKAVSHDR